MLYQWFAKWQHRLQCLGLWLGTPSAGGQDLCTKVSVAWRKTQKGGFVKRQFMWVFEMFFFLRLSIVFSRFLLAVYTVFLKYVVFVVWRVFLVCYLEVCKLLHWCSRGVQAVQDVVMTFEYFWCFLCCSMGFSRVKRRCRPMVNQLTHPPCWWISCPTSTGSFFWGKSLLLFFLQVW